MSTTRKDKKLSVPDGRVCSNCSALEGSENAPKLSACARCGLVLYCSRDCQRAHWKASHKQLCVAKADRVPHHRNPLESHRDASSDIIAKCTICLDTMSEESPTCTLPCSHVFHSKCVAELRKLGVHQACPLCRTPLPVGPEKLSEEAARRYVVVNRMVERGHASWSTLTGLARRELDAVVNGWRAAADQEFPLAQNNLGTLYYQGRGVAQSNVEAARWFKKSSNHGFAEAQCNLGDLFHRGRGVSQSDKEAARWYKKAADQGLARAQCNMGTLFEKGSGVAQSDVEAFRWYKKAADQGFAQAQCFLGAHYEKGRGVTQNFEEAVRCYKAAANQGLAQAQFYLGLQFHSGRGVARSDAEAMRWHKKAADQGYAQAQLVMGARFQTGHGVAQSAVEAARWFQKAASQGYTMDGRE